MEIIFKNRPAPNIKINSIENGLGLEIIYRKIDSPIESKVLLSKFHALELANVIRLYLSKYKNVKAENEVDKYSVKGTGTDLSPTVFIWIQHHGPNAEVLRGAFTTTEPEAEILAKALERWAKHPDL